MTETVRPTKKQRDILTFIELFIGEHGYSPSYREIMRALGYKSVSTVAIHIDGLIAKGYLRRRDNSARSLEVVTMRDTKLHADTQAFETELIKRITSAQLNETDTQTVKTALELLGLTDVVEKMSGTNQEPVPKE